jgi:calcineurin-like phosphoesterase family protein
MQSGDDWFVADWHLNHSNIIKYCRRYEFMTDTERELVEMADRGVIRSNEVKISPQTTARMTKAVLDNTNAVVNPGDRLWIIGDVFFAPKEKQVALAKQFRNSIKKGVEVRVIMGNHDDRELIATHFADKYSQRAGETTEIFKDRCSRNGMRPNQSLVFDQVLIRIDQQKIFLNHYPMRSWDCAHHGAWNLYGHVHDLFGDEDNGRLSPFFAAHYQDRFHGVLEEFTDLHHVSDDVKMEIVQKLMGVVADNNGVSLTLDVGVDNRVRGEGVPFGTPWSMADLRKYFFSKMPKWKARQDEFRNFVPASAIKEGAENVNLMY